MASNIKYSGSFKDSFGDDVWVYIFVEGYAGIVHPLSFGDDPVIIDYKGSDDSLLEPIIQSEAKLKLLLSKSNELFSDLMTLKENTFLVKIDKFNGLSLGYRWIGYIIPDQSKSSFTYLNEVAEISCVCPLTILKGIRMQEPNFNRSVTGRNSFKTILNTAIGKLGCYDQYLTPSINFGYDVTTNISLTPNYMTNFLNDFGVTVDGFMNSDGKGITYYDFIEKLSKSFFMQTFFDNGKLVMADYLIKLDPNSFFPSRRVAYKDSISYDKETMHLLIKNSEVVTFFPSVTETSSRFAYKAINGNMVNGSIRSWSTSVLGSFLNDWIYSPALVASPTYGLRRKGNGRDEDPYRIVLNDGMMESLVFYGQGVAGRMRYEIDGDKLFTIKMSFIMNVDRYLPVSMVGYGSDVLNHKFTAIRCCTIALNLDDPKFSMVIARRAYNVMQKPLEWYQVDLTYTRFKTHNEWDYDFSMNAISDPTIGYSAHKIYHFLLTEDDRGRVRTSGSMQYPRMYPVNPTSGAPYKRFRIFHYFSNGNSFYENDDEDDSLWNRIPIEVYQCELELTDEVRNDGEVVYTTRKGYQSVSEETREIGLNPTFNTGAVGALQAMTSYSIYGTLFPSDFITNVFRYNDTGGGMIGRLTTINSCSEMRLRYEKQVKIDFETIVKTTCYKERLDFSLLFDPSISFTKIYNRWFSATRQTINLKDNTNSITAIGYDYIVLPPSFSEYDETRELVEEFKY